MSTDHRPATCHYDRRLAVRVTRRHAEDCPSHPAAERPGECPAAGHGCAPCPEPHCLICGREHVDHDHPDTCPRCVGLVRADLADLDAAYADLATEALEGSTNGRLSAAAPIPGADAAVLIGPSVRLDLLRYHRELEADHYARDPIPPLAVLAEWEDGYRRWLGHQRAGRATVTSTTRYLRDQVPYLAQHATAPNAPDFVVFVHQVRALRAQLERVLHDEREPELGVECFECGERLVRRFRPPRRCQHPTVGRTALQHRLQALPAARQQLADLQLARTAWHLLPLAQRAQTPKPAPPARELVLAATPPTPVELAAARVPCTACSQGGLDNPEPGRSWECPGCRREFSPGEYANAVRRDLLERRDTADGWTHVTIAADAATTLVGVLISAGSIRKWAERGKVATQKTEQGSRLVFWPDVADQAVAAMDRAAVAAARRRSA